MPIQGMSIFIQDKGPFRIHSVGVLEGKFRRGFRPKLLKQKAI